MDWTPTILGAQDFSWQCLLMVFSSPVGPLLGGSSALSELGGNFSSLQAFQVKPMDRQWNLEYSLAGVHTHQALLWHTNHEGLHQEVEIHTPQTCHAFFPGKRKTWQRNQVCLLNASVQFCLEIVGCNTSSPLLGLYQPLVKSWSDPHLNGQKLQDTMLFGVGGGPVQEVWWVHEQQNHTN